MPASEMVPEHIEGGLEEFARADDCSHFLLRRLKIYGYVLTQNKTHYILSFVFVTIQINSSKVICQRFHFVLLLQLFTFITVKKLSFTGGKIELSTEEV